MMKQHRMVPTPAPMAEGPRDPGTQGKQLSNAKIWAVDHWTTPQGLQEIPVFVEEITISVEFIWVPCVQVLYTNRYIYIYTMCGPPVISWFINPINYSYKYHKP